MNLTLLHRKFNTQEKCISYLEKLRWGKTPACIHCGSTNVTPRKNSIKWHCNDENKDFSVLVGTIFENTRLPLPKFFEIMFLMNNAKMGISAAEISRAVGVKYQTAWFICHKTRCCMINKEIRLEGMVEMDETFIGGKPRKKYEGDPSIANLSTVTNKRGRGTKKTPVVGAVEKKGHVYVKIIEKLTSKNLLAMLRQCVKTDESIVITDSFRSYRSFDNAVEHITINESKEVPKGIKTVNTIHGFFSIIKNGIRGSFRSVSKKYLPFYLAEFSYKYNKRHLQKDSFTELLKNTVNENSCMLNYKPKKNTKQIFNPRRRQKKSLSLAG